MSATDISLSSILREGPEEQSPPSEQRQQPELSNFNPTDPDTVIAASRLADSQVPDGGYGWVVIFACSILTFWFVGTTYSWGVIQAALVAESVSSPSTLSFVGSLTCSFIAFLALINARIIRAIGARTTALIGVLLLGAGEIFSGFSTRSVGGLFMNAGVVMGVGASLQFMVVSTIPAQYFNKKRGLANGIVYAGGGLGGTIISFAMNGVIEKLGPAWTFRILGLTTLATGLPAAWLIKERTPITTATFIEWRLFKNVQFSTLFLAGTIGTFPLFVPPFFLPLYSTSLGLSPSAGAGLVAGFNFSSAVGRLACGFLSDSIGPVNTLFIALMMSALSMLVLWPVSSSLGPLIVFVIISGAANGGFFSTMPTVVGSVFGSRRVGVAMGMIVSGWAGGYLLGAPIAGYLLAAYGGEHSTLKAYHPAIFYAGTMALGAAGLVGIVRLKISRTPFKKL
ncbi:related to protein MCH2 (monocarboxylate permease homolog) [Phialocephala subalpina]|uniref:Related to protein MCH2 (Monocarboxylate permease homolog) n=1 Tax=Phialocephala subalpina TaxID=576137 RepID=A0A1L7XC42_9HELO|nr:related to protein MCH2 (monocarboxylate permease homolog) [Phialocephala subalpina]